VAEDLESEIQIEGFMVQGLRFRAYGSELIGLWFRVWG
jgi:hypothetical protein